MKGQREIVAHRRPWTPSQGDINGNHIMVRYTNSKVLRFANTLGTVFSSALPIASIVPLDYIHQTGLRLVVVAVFTLTFSLILSIVTNARRIKSVCYYCYVGLLLF